LDVLYHLFLFLYLLVQIVDFVFLLLQLCNQLLRVYSLLLANLLQGVLELYFLLLFIFFDGLLKSSVFCNLLCVLLLKLILEILKRLDCIVKPLLLVSELGSLHLLLFELIFKLLFIPRKSFVLIYLFDEHLVERLLFVIEGGLSVSKLLLHVKESLLMVDEISWNESFDLLKIK